MCCGQFVIGIDGAVDVAAIFHGIAFLIHYRCTGRIQLGSGYLQGNLQDARSVEMSFCRAGDDAEGVEMDYASVSTLSGLRKLVRLYLMCHPVEASGVQTGVGDVEASASAGQFDDGRREVFSFYVSFGADIEDDIDTLADALHIKIQDGRLSGLDVYVLLHRIEYGRLYFLQVFIVRIEIGQVIAVMDDMWVTFNVREDLLQGLGMGTEFEAFIPALDRNIRLKVYYLKDLGTYAAWKATKTTGQFDLKTFEVKASPLEKAEGLRPGMSVILNK